MLDFSQFCDYVKDNIRNYLSESFQKNNYEFYLDEHKNSYDMVSCLLCLRDKQKEDLVLKVFHLDVAYENYKRTGDLDAIVVMLATGYEASITKTDMKLPEFEVVAGDDGVSNVSVISNFDDPSANLYQDDLLIEISSKEMSDLVLAQINENVLLAIPVRSEKEYLDSLQELSVLENDDPEQLVEGAQIKFYDRNNNVILMDSDEIKEILRDTEQKAVSKKKSVFSR